MMFAKKELWPHEMVERSAYLKGIEDGINIGMNLHADIDDEDDEDDDIVLTRYPFAFGSHISTEAPKEKKCTCDDNISVRADLLKNIANETRKKYGKPVAGRCKWGDGETISLRYKRDDKDVTVNLSLDDILRGFDDDEEDE